MADEAMLSSAISAFYTQFGRAPEHAVFAPGRVNLIGEHTDYNDGFVLPFALPHRVIIVASRVKHTVKTSILSLTIDSNGPPVQFQINSDMCKGEPAWANYVKGTIFQYLNDIPENFAFNAVIVSNVPYGSGLSSSAALEVATATLLERMCCLNNVTGVEKALRCQKAEHDFVDNPCGIMDQFVSSMGQSGHLLLIDCRHQEHKLIPFGTGSSSPVVVVTNSNVKHNLSDSEYPVRVKQCQDAVKTLQTAYPSVKALRDCTGLEMLDAVKGQMDDVIYKRARHCITEDQRTLSATEALAVGDFERLGKLMTESHISLRDDYEVSCAELDALVDSALQVEGVYGSRMTGGGFGGCTVTLVKRSAVEGFIKHQKEAYLKKHNQECDCYTAAPSAGAGVILLTDALLEHAKKKAPKKIPIFVWVPPLITCVAALCIAVIVIRRR